MDIDQEDLIAVPDKQEQPMTVADELDAKARFLEVYAARNDGSGIESVCRKVGVPFETAKEWFEDRAFKSQIQHINERRVERVLEIFAESAVLVAQKTVETALSNGRYQQKAAQLIFEALGVKKTRESLVNIQENTLVIRTNEDLDKARERSAELDEILNQVKLHEPTNKKT